jgi:hypothetical protein
MDLNLLRRMAGIPTLTPDSIAKSNVVANEFRKLAGLSPLPIKEDDKEDAEASMPEDMPAEDMPAEEKDDEHVEAEMDHAEEESEEHQEKEKQEDSLLSFISPLAHKAEGLEGDAMVELLMQVYHAGVEDGKNEEVKEASSVIQKGGSIGEQPNRVVKSFDTPEQAKEYAKRMNKNLSPGEKQYYGIKYVVVVDKEAKA